MSQITKHNTATWIAVDWGTSRLRVWHMDAQGTVLDQKSCEQGMNGLQPSEFESVLLSQIDQWLAPMQITTVLACGMLGSRQGWAEVSYVATPCPAATIPAQAPTQDPRIQVHICPGIKQLSPADVMRGEETQVAGFLSGQTQFEGVICLPGTHSKWVQMQQTTITRFQTFLTGELYALLAKQSVLRHSIDVSAWDDEAFASAVHQSMRHSESISAKLFSLRAQGLLGDFSSASANATLSGYLIGLELASSQPFWQQQPVVIIGDSALSQRYAQALALLDVSSDLQNSEMLTLKGLALAYSYLQQQ
jgi:2-dehydro-3-deoxygalactonokinase